MRRTRQSIARTVLSLPGVILLVVAAYCPAQQAQQKRLSPLEKGVQIPAPPRQQEPWQPPATTLPKWLVNASALLFEQGLADPRGCEYREVEIGIGAGRFRTAGGYPIKTHGWVLPERAGEKARFAITWSGLVYPVFSIGPAADLKADVQKIDDQVRANREAQAKHPTMGGIGFGGFGGNEESSAVSATSLQPIKVCLLLRLGLANLAETVWAAGTEGAQEIRQRRPPANADLTSHGISYVSLANDFAWNLFDRALSAHMRGDDVVALADARKLTALRQAVEAKAQEMDFARPQNFGNRAAGPEPYIGFLGQLPDLLADQERRAREPERPPVPPPGSDKKKRIAALIAELDQVAVRQMSQPGGVYLGESPIVQALIAEGDDAVEPLLEVLVQDTRLTRSVQYWRDFHRSRTILSVHEAAYTALSGLMHSSFFGAASTGDNLTAHGLKGRLEVANRIREYWAKNRGVPLVERWFRTLADDVADPAQWLQAAANIVQHENVSVIPSSTAFSETVTTALPPGTRPRLRGEALRAKRDPSVAELMAQRIREIDDGQPIEPNSPHQHDVTSANSMAMMLAEWDIQAALPILKARMSRSVQVEQAGRNNGRGVFGIGPSIASLRKLRTRAGDPEALNDYASWVRTLRPSHVEAYAIKVFEPLWSHPEHPAIAAAATALFEDPKSPWSLWDGTGLSQSLMSSPLLGLKSFRSMILRTLADKSQIGTVEVDANGNVITIEGNSRTVEGPGARLHQGIESGVPGQPRKPFKPGTSAMPLRRADRVCEHLQQLPGIPRFLKQWPVAQRDEALAACIAFLKQYGERFDNAGRWRDKPATDPGPPPPPSEFFAFDPLDHPATPADVAEGRAIFSLAGQGGEMRLVHFPSYPLEARWTKLKVFPNDPPHLRSYDAEGHEVDSTPSLQEGRVWQAEELREGDTWHRYYGFVGRHALARVPAEEIELPGSWRDGWLPVSVDLDARIVIKQAATTGPIPAEVGFRNHHGVETKAPTGLVRTSASGPEIHHSLGFRLIRVSDQPQLPNPFAALAGEEEAPFPPEEIAPLPFRRHSEPLSHQTVAPAGEVSAFQVDLRSLFRVEEPGRYRLEITFTDLKTEKGTPGKVELVFPVTSAKTD